MDITVLYDLSYGMYAIGVKDGERNCGCIVNTVFQISTEGPIIALSMNRDNYTYELLKRNQKFSVSILSEDSDPIIINKLGFVSGKDHNKWEGFAYEELDHLPVVNDHVLGQMICEVISMSEASTHFVILAKVIHTVKKDQRAAMTYAYYHNVIKGKAPKKAPTYQEEKPRDSKKERWICSVCGYVYEGADFNAEPDSYTCPICGVSKLMFEKK